MGEPRREFLKHIIIAKRDGDPSPGKAYGPFDDFWDAQARMPWEGRQGWTIVALPLADAQQLWYDLEHPDG